MVTQAAPTPSATPTLKPTPVPTPDITPNVAYKTIKVGDSGDSVAQMQRRLAELGYYSGDIDGRFGNQTRRAVERFQYNNGLSADGIAGRNTLTILYEYEKVVLSTDSGASPTPAPDRNTNQDAARTETPPGATLAPTFVPTPTPAPGGTSAPTFVPTIAPASVVTASPADGAVSTDEPGEINGTETAQPTAEPTPPLSTEPGAPLTPVPLTDVGFVFEGESERMFWYSDEDDEEYPLLPLEVTGGAANESLRYVPFFAILETTGVVVVPDPAKNHETYAFLLGMDSYLFSYELDEGGMPVKLAVEVNRIPQVMTDRNVFMLDGLVYLSLAEMEKLTGVGFALDEGTQTYTVSLPAE